MMKRLNHFTLTSKSTVLIYGASFIGRQFHQKLQEQGIKTAAFIDVNAAVIKNVDDVPVYTLDTVPLTKAEKNSIIIIVAVTNTQEHLFIADYLHQAGYSNVLYKSGANAHIQSIDIIYDGIFNGMLSIATGIEVEECQSHERWADKCYVKDLEHSKLLVRVPYELLFIGKQKDGSGPLEMGSSLQGRPIAGAEPLLSAYDYFEGKDTDTFERFIQEHCHSQDSVKDTAGWMRWLEERRYESRTFAIESSLDSRYFEKNPIEVEWSSRGLFQVVSRYRQAVYQLARNNKLIYCAITKDDYAAWKNESQVQPCIETLKKYKLSVVYTPILHPNFIDYPCMRENYGATRLMKVCKYLFENSVELHNKKVLDAGSYLSYFAQNFNRMGADVTSIEFEDANYEPACALNRLLRCDDITMIHGGIERLNPDLRFSITIMTAVLNWHLDSDLGMTIIQNIDLVTEDLLIWESGDEIEREKKFILNHSKFKTYTRLQSTFGTGKMRELGIFMK